MISMLGAKTSTPAGRRKLLDISLIEDGADQEAEGDKWLDLSGKVL
jgi:hypothetical protein